MIEWSMTFEQCTSLNPEQEEAVRAILGPGSTIQFCTSLNADPSMDCWFLARAGKNLVGVLSIFAPGRHEAEFSAWVLPEYRRQGIFTHLLERALDTLAGALDCQVLLVHDPREPAGTSLVKRWGLTLHHREFSMVHAEPEPGTNTETPIPGLSFRTATIHDRAALLETQTAAFGGTARDTEILVDSFLMDRQRRVVLGVLEGKAIASASLYFEADQSSINALAVHPAWQGKGIGRQFLKHLVALCPKTVPVALDVDTDNPRALGLYTSCGFKVVRQADYWKLPRDRN